MRIAISGASGLVGTHLVPALGAGGHEVIRLTRRHDAGPGTAGWDPATGAVDAATLGSVDAVIHLAGAGIADRRWSDAHKREIRDSRVGPTRALCEWLRRGPHPPAVLLCASAIGYYGDRGTEVLTEASAPGSGFLPEVCVEWERATDPARAAGIRVVNLRLGIVLSTRGGALRKMLPPFRAGLGGRLGSGTQGMSWISIDDVVGGVSHCLEAPGVIGPVNVTAPAPASNAEFTAVLGRVLKRPALLPVPAFAIGALFGEMGRALLLEGQHVVPRVLLETGYAFRHARLDDALRHELDR
jgi:hypothetical protein